MKSLNKFPMHVVVRSTVLREQNNSGATEKNRKAIDFFQLNAKTHSPSTLHGLSPYHHYHGSVLHPVISVAGAYLCLLGVDVTFFS